MLALKIAVLAKGINKQAISPLPSIPGQSYQPYRASPAKPVTPTGGPTPVDKPVSIAADPLMQVKSFNQLSQEQAGPAHGILSSISPAIRGLGGAVAGGVAAPVTGIAGAALGVAGNATGNTWLKQRSNDMWDASRASAVVASRGAHQFLKNRSSRALDSWLDTTRERVNENTSGGLRATYSLGHNAAYVAPELTLAGRLGGYKAIGPAVAGTTTFLGKPIASAAEDSYLHGNNVPAPPRIPYNNGDAVTMTDAPAVPLNPVNTPDVSPTAHPADLPAGDPDIANKAADRLRSDGVSEYGIAHMLQNADPATLAMLALGGITALSGGAMAPLGLLLAGGAAAHGGMFGKAPMDAVKSVLGYIPGMGGTAGTGTATPSPSLPPLSPALATAAATNPQAAWQQAMQDKVLNANELGLLKIPNVQKHLMTLSDTDLQGALQAMRRGDAGNQVVEAVRGLNTSPTVAWWFGRDPEKEVANTFRSQFKLDQPATDRIIRLLKTVKLD